MKKALITGITGQDGSYLTELLLKKGYEVHGIIRRASTFNTQRIDEYYQDPRYFSPADTDVLKGPSSKMKEEFGWQHETDFADLVRIMVESDIKTWEDKGEVGLDYLG